jgi:tetratricopeptide (TPR) repeat protein
MFAPSVLGSLKYRGNLRQPIVAAGAIGFVLSLLCLAVGTASSIAATAPWPGGPTITIQPPTIRGDRPEPGEREPYQREEPSRPTQPYTPREPSNLERAEALFDQGNEFYRAKNYDQAIAAYNAAFALAPKERGSFGAYSDPFTRKIVGNWYSALALRELGVGDYAEAIKWIEQALRAQPPWTLIDAPIYAKRKRWLEEIEGEIAKTREQIKNQCAEQSNADILENRLCRCLMHGNDPACNCQRNPNHRACLKVDPCHGSGAKLWKSLPATMRGIAIENGLAATEYKEWRHVGALQGGTFPYFDFYRGNTLLSLKSVNTTGSTWRGRMQSHIRDLARTGFTVGTSGAPAINVLDIRVQPGGFEAAKSLIEYGQQLGLKVVVKECG